MLIDLDAPEPIERFVRRDLPLHLYELGDLDPANWPLTRFWGWRGQDGELAALALLYRGADPPVLVALDRDEGEASARLLIAIRPALPDRVYAHLSPGLVTHLRSRWQPSHRGRHDKMMLVDPHALVALEPDEVERLGPADLGEVLALYRRAYPETSFDPRTLDSGAYHGIREDGRLVAVAGVHVWSTRYRVAALGNIATDPACRGRGLAGRATAALCRFLQPSVDAIGLNVRGDNQSAIRCYHGLGFVRVAEHDEYMLEPA